MTIDLGNLIMAACMVIGAFCTAIGFAYSAKSEAMDAHTRIDSLNDQIVDLRARHDALDSKIVEKLSEIEKALARIQGILSIMDKSE